MLARLARAIRMGPFASAWAIPLAAGGMASLVAIPVSVAWAVVARGWLGLPDDFALADPGFLVYACVAIALLVAVPFALAFRFSREPLANGSVAAGAILAMVLPLWLATPLAVHPNVAGGPTYGLIAHLLVGGTAFLVVLRAAALARAPQEAAEGIVAPHAR